MKNRYKIWYWGSSYGGAEPQVKYWVKRKGKYMRMVTQNESEAGLFSEKTALRLGEMYARHAIDKKATFKFIPGDDFKPKESHVMVSTKALDFTGE